MEKSDTVNAIARLKQAQYEVTILQASQSLTNAQASALRRSSEAIQTAILMLRLASSSAIPESIEDAEIDL